MRASAFIAISDCAPRSNTSSSTPTCSTRSSSAQIAATVFSVSVRGAPERCEGAGASIGSAARAWRSILPLALSGKRSRNTNAEGTM